MATITVPVAELSVQEYSGGFIIDGHRPFCIFSCKTFREMLIETQRRGQLFWNNKKVIRLEGDLLPVVSESEGPQLALAVPCPAWSFWGGR